ncbi:leucyl/phenylalanyl-tRNA--protein transferase [Altericista sp. CCNU0014]|uniref:leucyl/phenylalanyl-tRNA--protein transferase n=1 Tax=Altericista sp. CCNU0014 TaxID=3082949 RepID=UPI003850A84B
MWIDVEAIIDGYRQGYFLMAEDDRSDLTWYTSQERTLIPLDERFHVPRSLRRALNQTRFDVAINRDFEGVVEGCANRATTWISEELMQIYAALHRAGWAHSFETWSEGQLAGGILGISIGGMFIGESMFYALPEGSKVAMVKLVEHLRSRGYLMFDAQLMNPHLARFGAYTLGGRAYQKLLIQALRQSCLFV